MPETLFECAGPRLAGQTRFQASRRKILLPEKPLDSIAGFPLVRPYEAGHMSSFPASPNRPGTPEPATTVSMSGVAAIQFPSRPGLLASSDVAAVQLPPRLGLLASSDVAAIQSPLPDTASAFSSPAAATP
jgi:hypothetical protein